MSQTTHHEGSPPLARGTDQQLQVSGRVHRITPACAGNSSSRADTRTVYWDHPRLRGEQQAMLRQYKGWWGSPPLARGTGAHLRTTRSSGRITPACAGNSWATYTKCPAAWDHPRLRGEQCRCQQVAVKRLGSPPLARGTASRSAARGNMAGITPACAGNRSFIVVSLSSSQDHPRLRGEQAVSHVGDASIAGSPPLARGTD